MDEIYIYAHGLRVFRLKNSINQIFFPFWWSWNVEWRPWLSRTIGLEQYTTAQSRSRTIHFKQLGWRHCSFFFMWLVNTNSFILLGKMRLHSHVWVCVNACVCSSMLTCNPIQCVNCTITYVCNLCVQIPSPKKTVLLIHSAFKLVDSL